MTWQELVLPKELDEIDRAILNALQSDARISFADIARQLKIGESTVRFRVKKLIQNGVITKFATMLDPRKIGLPVTSVIMIKADPKQLDKVCKVLSSFEEAHHILQRTGEFDLIIMAHTSNMEHLNELVQRIKSVPGVREAFVSVATRIIKVDASFEL